METIDLWDSNMSRRRCTVAWQLVRERERSHAYTRSRHYHVKGPLVQGHTKREKVKTRPAGDGRNSQLDNLSPPKLTGIPNTPTSAALDGLTIVGRDFCWAIDSMIRFDSMPSSWSNPLKWLWGQVCCVNCGRETQQSATSRGVSPRCRIFGSAV